MTAALCNPILLMGCALLSGCESVSSLKYRDIDCPQTGDVRISGVSGKMYRVDGLFYFCNEGVWQTGVGSPPFHVDRNPKP